MKYELPNIWAQGDALVAQIVGGVLGGSGPLSHAHEILNENQFAILK